ncbi:MAG: hypothetical protein M3Z36_05785, partial [Acidobacteriota bacterium]|nr:hypothetical protein [Acidobacteriota bacterium]
SQSTSPFLDTGRMAAGGPEREAGGGAHGVQFLWLRNAPSTVRKLLGASTNAVGWRTIVSKCRSMRVRRATLGDDSPVL